MGWKSPRKWRRAGHSGAGRWKVHEDFFSSVAGGLESAWDDGVSRCFYVGDFREADRSEYTSSLQNMATKITRARIGPLLSSSAMPLNLSEISKNP